jgi:hypothetical protein
MTSQNEQTPRRGFHGASVVVAVAVLLVLGIGGAFAVGQATARSTDQPGPAASPSSLYGHSGDYGPMVGWAQGHRSDLAWMRDHMGELAWMRHHAGQWQWMRDHMDDFTWMRRHAGQWQWMRTHPGQWAWMRQHWNGMSRMHHRWERWNHSGTGPGSGSNRGGTNSGPAGVATTGTGRRAP